MASTVSATGDGTASGSQDISIDDLAETVGFNIIPQMIMQQDSMRHDQAATEKRLRHAFQDDDDPDVQHTPVPTM